MEDGDSCLVSAAIGFQRAQMPRTPLLAVPFRGAPHGGRERLEDMLLLQRPRPALTNRGFHCGKEGQPLSLFPGLVPLGTLSTMISHVRGADVYVHPTFKIHTKWKRAIMELVLLGYTLVNKS